MISLKHHSSVRSVATALLLLLVLMASMLPKSVCARAALAQQECCGAAASTHCDVGAGCHGHTYHIADRAPTEGTPSEPCVLLPSFELYLSHAPSAEPVLSYAVSVPSSVPSDAMTMPVSARVRAGIVSASPPRVVHDLRQSLCVYRI